jgi:uncharacterized membrane protein
LNDPKASIQQAAKAVIAENEFRHQLVGQLASQITIHQQGGPLPAPEVLKKYNEAVSDGAERIMKMAERDQKHIHRNQNAGFALAFLGEILGWSIIIFAMLGAYNLVMKDKALEGAFSFFAGLGLLAAGYYERRKTRQTQNLAANQNPPKAN